MNPPASFSLFGLTLYWYGALIAVGFLLAMMYCLRRASDFGLREDDFIDVLIFAVPAAIIGARLYYVVFNFELFRGDFASVFRLRDGGIAMYGSIIGALAAAYTVCRVKKFSVAAVFDLGALGLLIGQSVGRWGNFMNREAFGSETTVPWRMGLTPPGAETFWVHPTFLYESLWNAIGFVLIHICSKRRDREDWTVFLLYLSWYGFGRMFIEGLRSDSLYIPGTAIRISQLVAAVTFIVSALLLLARRRRRRRQ